MATPQVPMTAMMEAAASADDRDDGGGVDAHGRERGDEHYDLQDDVDQRHDEARHRLVAFALFEDAFQHLFDELDDDEPHDEDDDAVENVESRVLEKVRYAFPKFFHSSLACIVDADIISHPRPKSTAAANPLAKRRILQYNF